MTRAHVVQEKNIKNAMEHNKLVRDKIPEYIKEKGEDVVFHIADDKEYWEKLLEKVLEEFKISQSIEELADLLEVLEAIAKYKGFDTKKLEDIKNKKAKEKGRFDKRLILDRS